MEKVEEFDSAVNRLVENQVSFEPLGDSPEADAFQAGILKVHPPSDHWAIEQ
jgi:hypothetical protein